MKGTPKMRVQLALNVTDINEAIAFYSKLFNTTPHKVREGYANFAIDDPALKLVLIENTEGGTLNHLGVEVFDESEVLSAVEKLTAAGLKADVRTKELCCHAVQDKVWTADPDGAPWEIYTVVDDTPGTGAAATVCCTDDQREASTACCVESTQGVCC